MAYIIVGLGNPGQEYTQTRHNTGRMLVQKIVDKLGGEFSYSSKIYSQTATVEIAGENVKCILPDTFMNKSGKAVAPLIKSLKAAEKLVVIYDDFQLPLGTTRMAFNRSSGGHNGVESIIKALKTEAFVRIRIGIGATKASGSVKVLKGAEEVEKFILGGFKKEELEKINKLSKKVQEVLEVFVADGREKATMVCNS